MERAVGGDWEERVELAVGFAKGQVGAEALVI